MEDLHATIETYLRERRKSATRKPPPPAALPDLAPRLTRLTAVYGRDWLMGLQLFPAFVQQIVTEAAEDRLAGMDEYPGIVRTEMRHSGPPHDDCPHSTAPNEAQQALRILRDAHLWPWQRPLWRTDDAAR